MIPHCLFLFKLLPTLSRTPYYYYYAYSLRFYCYLVPNHFEYRFKGIIQPIPSSQNHSIFPYNPSLIHKLLENFNMHSFQSGNLGWILRTKLVTPKNCSCFLKSSTISNLISLSTFIDPKNVFHFQWNLLSYRYLILFYNPYLFIFSLHQPLVRTGHLLSLRKGYLDDHEEDLTKDENSRSLMIRQVCRRNYSIFINLMKILILKAFVIKIEIKKVDFMYLSSNQDYSRVYILYIL